MSLFTQDEAAARKRSLRKTTASVPAVSAVTSFLKSVGFGPVLQFFKVTGRFEREVKLELMDDQMTIDQVKGVMRSVRQHFGDPKISSQRTRGVIDIHYIWVIPDRGFLELHLGVVGQSILDASIQLTNLDDSPSLS